MTDTPAHLYELGALLAGEGASLNDILRTLLDEGATELDLVRATKRIKHVSYKGARELVENSGLIAVGPRQVTIIVPEDDPWRRELFTSDQSNEGDGEDKLHVTLPKPRWL